MARLWLSIHICVAAVISATTAAWAADMPVKAAPLSAPAPWLNLFSGFSVAPDAYFGYAGGVVALNRNLYTDGWLVRLSGGAGHYEYNIVPGVKNGVDFQVGDFMLGYQQYVGATRFTLYAGTNVESHDNNKDPAAVVRGTEWGFKVQGEVFHQFNEQWYGLLIGNYSTVFKSYFAMGKVGYKITPTIAIGPELISLGNERFDQIHLGPFISFDIGPRVQLILSGGYSWDNRANTVNDSSGGYAAVHLRGDF